MSNTPNDDQKSMWDFAREADGKAASAQAAQHNAQSLEPSDIDVDDWEKEFSAKLGPADPEHIGTAVASVTPHRNKHGLLKAAVIAVLAVGSIGLIYVQGTKTATSHSNNAVTAERVSPTPMPAAYTPEQSTTAVAPKHVPSPSLEQSMAEFLAGSATVSPVAALAPSQWRDAKCSSCHTWTQARLCDQGKWYKTHGKAALDRVDHPYGGDFKRSLLTWANQGC